MKSKDWAFECAVDWGLLDSHHDQLVEQVVFSLRQQMADHIFGLLQQDDAICIQRSETTIRNDDAHRMVTFEETLRVRPLVLCKDCKYYQKAEMNVITSHDMVCAYAACHNFYRTPDDFCSKGERRGGDD